MVLEGLYGRSLALLTDLYELTMASGYWKSGLADREAAFTLSFRKAPFGGGYAVACGLAHVLELLRSFRFTDDDLTYLATLTGNDGRPLFERPFLDYLAGMELRCTVHAVPEGTVVFPGEPLLRVVGPVAQAQILETSLLNAVNFQTLVATKAARICSVAGEAPVLEFGLRRAQGFDGALAASRAAYVGGCAGTSNVLAGRLFGIPVRGTHAHSWVMCFESELEAFLAYADASPNNCVFLVDTYDTLDGVRHAVEVGQRLRRAGHELVGVRLDSGDLAWLSREARRILDEGGFPGAVVVASNDLDEHVMASLREQGAAIGVWGVGTRLVTAYDQPALGGVYKLTALRDAVGAWVPKVKLSEQAVKTSTPGVLQVRRYRRGDEYVADAVYDEGTSLDRGCTIVDPLDPTRRKTLDPGLAFEDLLVPVVEGGRVVHRQPTLAAIRERVRTGLAGFHEGIRRFVHPHAYPVGLERSLYDLRTRLVLEARGLGDD